MEYAARTMHGSKLRTGCRCAGIMCEICGSNNSTVVCTVINLELGADVLGSCVKYAARIIHRLSAL